MHAKHLRETLCALLIGDGSIYKNSSRTVYFNLAHSVRQKDYLIWKVELLRKVLADKGVTPKLSVRGYYATAAGRKYLSYRSSFCWTKFLPSFYKKAYRGRKDYGWLLSQMHSDLHLALWMFDDGNEDRSYQKSRVDGHRIPRNPRFRLSIYEFTEGQANLAVKWFEYHFSITPRISRQKQGPVLRFSVRDSKKLFELIKPYSDQLESMRYKFRWSYDSPK